MEILDSVYDLLKYPFKNTNVIIRNIDQAKRFPFQGSYVIYLQWITPNPNSKDNNTAIVVE